MKVMKLTMKATILCVIGLAIGCKTEETSVTPTTTTTTTTVPDVYKKIYGATSITSDGTFVTIKTAGVPDHTSPYYSTTNALYKAFSGTTPLGYEFKKNPNVIATQSLTFKIPLNPVVANNHAATALGPIGVALNGVAFYNQYAGPNNQVLTTEIFSFDNFNGHPTATSQYHYHVEPLYLTTVKSTKSGLMGFLMDGFPVYGPTEESGKAVANADLDVYHGHTHVTVDFPKGIYHYHFTADAPYLNGNGFYGTAGTLTQ